MLHDPRNISWNFSSNLFRSIRFCRFARKSEKRRRYLTSSSRTLGSFFSIDPAHVSGQEEIERKQFYLLAFSRCGAHGVARSNDSDGSPRKETAPMFAIFISRFSLLYSCSNNSIRQHLSLIVYASRIGGYLILNSVITFTAYARPYK